ncbi:MAG: hypothetical protein AB7P33_08970 [Dehalococcoidia bacterium]
MTEDVFSEGFETSRVNVGRSAVRTINAASVVAQQSAVQRLTADVVDADNSAFGNVRASTVDLDESAAGFIAADYVKVENSRVFVLLAPRVSGNVKAVLTLPAAFALGAGYYFARRLMMGLSRRSDS